MRGLYTWRYCAYNWRMVLEHHDYRSYLRALLSERQLRRASYSLRAFARDIGVPASHLSMVFAGKGHLSIERGIVVATKLGLAASEAEYFRLLVEYAAAKSIELKDAIAHRMRQIAGDRAVTDLSVDRFKLISDWFHFPILMLTEIPGETLEPASVAARIGIAKNDAAVAVERLVRLELIQRNEDGSYTRVNESTQVNSPAPNAALRRFHLQFLEKAARAVEEQNPEERYIGSETLAIATEHLDIVREEMARFRSALVARLGEAAKTQPATEVYHLNLNFFRVTCPKSTSQLQGVANLGSAKQSRIEGSALESRLGELSAIDSTNEEKEKQS